MKKRHKKNIGIYLLLIGFGSLVGYHLLHFHKPKPVHPITSPQPPLPTKQQMIQEMSETPLPTASAILSVPALDQLPQLHNGCEITSLAMLLAYAKHPESKLTLAKEEPKDPTPIVFKANTQTILSWGNPDVGFVGSVQGKTKLGYGIYHKPLASFLNTLLPGRALDLTGKTFSQIEAIVARGTPVEVWDTTTFSPTQQWVHWNTPEGTFQGTFYEHAVVLVGYTKNSVVINNPLTGEAAEKVAKTPFIDAWEQLGHQALAISIKKYQTPT